MTSIYQTFSTDPKLETNGILVEYDDLRFLLARAGGSNAKFRKVFQAKAKPYRYKIENELLSEDVANRMLAEAYAEAVILRADAKDEDGEWVQNKLPTEDGSLTDATPAKITELLIKLPLLFTDVQSMASNVSNFRREQEEEDAKN